MSLSSGKTETLLSNIMKQTNTNDINSVAKETTSNINLNKSRPLLIIPKIIDNNLGNIYIIAVIPNNPAESLAQDNHTNNNDTTAKINSNISTIKLP